ncbi:MAG: AMP-binding protein, partial [Xanthobacteraceae bacterium]|nr:AMP-binding protein [Xanthobacteraceae bacterium]
MFDLGTTFVAGVARDPDALAIVDGSLRLTYAQWYGKISALVAAFDQLGLAAGDHLVTVLTNRWEAATLHWACQFAGLIITPLNWRASADDLDFCLADADAKAIVYEDVAAPAVLASKQAQSRARIAVDAGQAGELSFPELLARDAFDAQPRADAGDWSVMLYTSGTTARPKGVPRRQRTERAAALAHVAQNLY